MPNTDFIFCCFWEGFFFLVFFFLFLTRSLEKRVSQRKPCCTDPLSTTTSIVALLVEILVLLAFCVAKCSALPNPFGIAPLAGCGAGTMPWGHLPSANFTSRGRPYPILLGSRHWPGVGLEPCLGASLLPANFISRGWMIAGLSWYIQHLFPLSLKKILKQNYRLAKSAEVSCAEVLLGSKVI